MVVDPDGAHGVSSSFIGDLMEEYQGARPDRKRPGAMAMSNTTSYTNQVHEDNSEHHDGCNIMEVRGLRHFSACSKPTEACHMSMLDHIRLCSKRLTDQDRWNAVKL